MINYDLSQIRTIIFDVDGVLSSNTVPMDVEGNPSRTLNIKDGYAIQLAQKAGIRIAIITGGFSESIEKRYNTLGVTDIYMKSKVKTEQYEDYKAKYGYSDNEIIYIGDDIPDYQIMQRCGCPCCPADAANEIKSISRYISQKTGGNGVARDVIEQVMRVKNLWMNHSDAFGW